LVGHIVVLLSLLTSGCGPSGGTAATVSQSPVTPIAADPSAALVLAAVDNGFHRVPIALTTDYGFLVMNAGDDEQPIASVSVGFRSERRIIQCGSLAEFEAALRKIPAGSTIHRHERCLMPASRGRRVSRRHRPDIVTGRHHGRPGTGDHLPLRALTWIHVGMEPKDAGHPTHSHWLSPGVPGNIRSCPSPRVVIALCARIIGFKAAASG
jgi:hypothetical protein